MESGSTGGGSDSVLRNAVTGEEIGVASSDGLDFSAMLEYGRTRRRADAARG